MKINAVLVSQRQHWQLKGEVIPRPQVVFFHNQSLCPKASPPCKVRLRTSGPPLRSDPHLDPQIQRCFFVFLIPFSCPVECYFNTSDSDEVRNAFWIFLFLLRWPHMEGKLKMEDLQLGNSPQRRIWKISRMWTANWPTWFWMKLLTGI